MAPTSDLLDWDGDAPRSRRYGDVYFSAVDGLAESRAVFLQGCGLPERWQGRRRFVVGEIGFGTGLNILALLDLWRRTRPAGGRLNIFTLEADLMSAGEAARALSAWPELSDLAETLIAAWPAQRPGFQRRALPGLDAVLDICVGEAGAALAAWRGQADAWFLDGFAPAKNPEAWRPEVLDLIAARSAPGAVAATFTVAGAVRRGLADAGFEVTKQPGFGRKRERLEAIFPGVASDDESPRVAVIGAGIAGACLTHAFQALGVRPRLFDARRPGGGASGAPAALVGMRLDAGGGPPARLHVQALQRARDIYRAEAPGAVLDEGVLQIEGQGRDAARFDRLAQWDGFPPGAVERLSTDAAGAILGEPSAVGALKIHQALVVEPSRLLPDLIGDVEVETVAVVTLDRMDAGWRLLGAGGRVLAEADLVCIAAGSESDALVPGAADFLRPVRGQVSWTQEAGKVQATAWGGYLAPIRAGGAVFGATHDRGDRNTEVRAADHTRNLALLAKARPGLAADLGVEGLQGWAGVRASTPDHLPVAGAVGEGLWILAGLGGRGFTLAPLLAEHVAALALGEPSPLPDDLAAAVNPDRFTDGEFVPGGAASAPP